MTMTWQQWPMSWAFDSRVELRDRRCAIATGRGAGDGSRAAGDALHVPVMVDEIVGFVDPKPGKCVLDGTLGLGGHSERFLEAGARVCGVDQDQEALDHAQARLARFADRLTLLHGNAAVFPALLGAKALGWEAPCFDAVLFDLGVSSWQLSQAIRGFSFMHEGPLDMRMNPAEGPSAAEAVNTWSEEELARVLWVYGEERRSREIASALVARREVRPFATTSDLAEVVTRCVRGGGPIHPATRTFQALRIAVNRELAVLPTMLTEAVRWLKPGGKLAVISFHSLEDRIVKRFLRDHSVAEIDDPTWPAPKPNPDYCLDLPARKMLKASAEEVTKNPRARSACLRMATKQS